MANIPFILSELVHTTEHSVREVQLQFDRYQRSAFIQRQPEFFALELCGEAGELANLEKKRWKGKQIEQHRLADEAADVFIALMNYANARGIDLGHAIQDKLHRIEEKRAHLAEKGETY